MLPKTKNSSQKANKPKRGQPSTPKVQEHDPKEKKKRMSLAETMKEFGAEKENRMADHVQLPEGITFDEFRKMDIFTEEGITEFCKQVSDLRGISWSFPYL